MDELMPWAQTLAVVALGGGGVWAAALIGRRRWWPAPCAAGALLIAIFGAARWVPWLELVAPFRWVMYGRLEYALLAPAAALALIPLLQSLPQRRQARIVGGLLVVLIGHYALMPFLMPALLWHRMGSLHTRIDDDGVCRQTTPYTCGPAASVTALHCLGIEATEAELARAMATSPAL